MKRAIAIFLSLAIVIALCPAMISSASEGGSKIDLSGYLDGMTNISKFAQPVATASASYENWGIGIAALLDGDTNTRFVGVNEADADASASFTPMWIQLDLQDVYTVGKMEFNSWQNGTKAGLPTAFTIQVSTDGTEWTTVYAEADLPLTTVANSSLYSFSFDAVDARYVKLDVTAIGGACDVGNYVCLSELSVFTGTKAEEVVPSTSPEIDLTHYVEGMTSASGFAQNVVSTNHSEEAWGLGVATLIDGVYEGATRYIGTGPATFEPTWVMVDLQKVYTVDKFAFYTWHFNNTPGMPKDFTIEVSEDGENWTVVHTQTDLAVTDVPNSNLYEFSFKAVDARYVKLNVTAIAANADTGPHLCLHEVKVFGVEKVEEEEVVPSTSPEIDLTHYVEGMTSASGFAQNVVSTNHSEEAWGLGVATLIDGVYEGATRYIGTGPATFEPTWVMVDLQKVYTVDKFAFYTWHFNNTPGMPKDFTIEVSEDGENWTVVHTQTDLAVTDVPNSNLYEFSFKAVDARYVKLNVTAIAANADTGPHLCLHEVKVFGVEKVEEEEVVPSTSPEIDLTHYVEGMTSASGFAQNVVSTNHSEEAWGLGVATLIDGVYEGATRYIGTGPATFEPTWVMVDLQKVYTVDKFAFYTWHFNNTPGMPKDFTIEVSEDGENWTVVHTQTDLAVTDVPNSNLYEFSFKAVDARYVKLNVTAIAANADTGPHLCLHEVKVFGVEKTGAGDGDEGVESLGEKIDLTVYVAGMTSASGFAQNVVSTNHSEEAWGLGVASLIDGKTVGDPRYIGTGPATFEPTWVMVDLQKVYTVDKFAFYSWHFNNTPGMPKDFTIEVSEDGENWTVVHTQTDLAVTDVPNSNLYEFSFKAVDARYVKLNVTAIAANADTGPHLCLCEVEVYGLNTEDEEEDNGEKLEINTDKVTVSGEYTPNMGKNNLFDGKLDTVFAAIDPDKAPGTRMDEWFQLDLQQVYTINRVRFANRSDAVPLSGLPSIFDIMVSDDGETWKVVKSVNGISESDITDLHWLTVDFDPVEARYVRVRAYDIGAVGEAVLGYVVTLREFEVHTAEGKIDLSSYVEGMTSASNYPQNVVTASQSFEFWGWGMAGLIDGVVGTVGIFAGAPNVDGAPPVEGLKNEITIDLQAAYFLDAIRFASMAANSVAGLPASFKLEVSLDSANWTTVMNKTGITADDADDDGQFYTFDFNRTSAIRYVRITVTKVCDQVNEELGYCTALSELELYGALDPTTSIKPDNYGKIDLSKAIIRATNSYNLWGHGTGNLYNGSQNANMFIATSVDDGEYYAMFKDKETFENTSNEFIKIRLDGLYEIDLMRFQSQFAASGRGVPNSYTLEVSVDGETWTTALFVDGKQISTDDWYSDEIAPVQARYLRLKFHNFIAAGDLGYAAHLKELEFYGVMLEKDQIDLDVPAPEPPALDPLPGDSAQTGDATTILVCATMTVATLMLAVLVLNRRKFAQ